MEVTVGPIPAPSVVSYVTYARKCLRAFMASPDAAGFPPEVAETFERYHDRWDLLAHDSDVVRWSEDIDAEELRWLVHMFARVARWVADDPVYPAEELGAGMEFYTALVNALLTALEACGGTDRDLAEELRCNFPGVIR